MSGRSPQGTPQFFRRQSRCPPVCINFGLTSVRISDECISAVNDLRSKRGPTKPQFVIFKISDDRRTVVVEESSPEKDYEEFLQRISSAVEPNGDPAARYAVYDVEYSLGGDGKR